MAGDGWIHLVLLLRWRGTVGLVGLVRGGGHPVGYLRGQACAWFLGSDCFLALIPPAVARSGGCGWGCGWLFVEMWIVDARASLFSAKVVVRMCRVVIFFDLGQVVKGGRWMPWHQEPMKDVGGRDRPGGAVNRAVIPGCPNGGTQLESCPVTCI